MANWQFDQHAAIHSQQTGIQLYKNRYLVDGWKLTAVSTKTKRKSKGNFWPSAETETLMKVAICQLSGLKPKPNFGWSLVTYRPSLYHVDCHFVISSSHCGVIHGHNTVLPQDKTRKVDGQCPYFHFIWIVSLLCHVSYNMYHESCALCKLSWPGRQQRNLNCEDCLASSYIRAINMLKNCKMKPAKPWFQKLKSLGFLVETGGDPMGSGPPRWIP